MDGPKIMLEEDYDLPRFEEMEDDEDMGDVGSESIHLKGVHQNGAHYAKVHAPACINGFENSG